MQHTGAESQISAADMQFILLNCCIYPACIVAAVPIRQAIQSSQSDPVCKTQWSCAVRSRASQSCHHPTLLAGLAMFQYFADCAHPLMLCTFCWVCWCVADCAREHAGNTLVQGPCIVAGEVSAGWCDTSALRCPAWECCSGARVVCLCAWLCVTLQCTVLLA